MLEWKLNKINLGNIQQIIFCNWPMQTLVIPIKKSATFWFRVPLITNKNINPSLFG
jgi:hypothetical protein